MMNANEIVHWLEDERERARELLADEPNKHVNHLATAYMAEIELITRLLTDIENEGSTTRNAGDKDG